MSTTISQVPLRRLRTLPAAGCIGESCGQLARPQAAATHESSTGTAAAKQEIADVDAQWAGTAGLARTVEGLRRGYTRGLPAARAKELEELAALRTEAVRRSEDLVN
ncbi:hypothetical protein [Streptomyces sp. NBC_00887]|uniref:hypothetical protein n=1 Tax=Streptomyces sp. NBC_00887 TaxID=2975859 RepID=UPI00386E5C6E|nr:hypothetical protein OG844_15780 [Streptomyces sp. NBC_00887]